MPLIPDAAHDSWIARFLPEYYSLHVGPSTFTVCFRPVLFFEGYSEAQLRALVDSSTWEVSFADEMVTPDGRLEARYDLTGKGDAFRVLGSVAWGVLDWARQKKPDYLFWWSLCPRRQTLYSKIVTHFERKGSGWYRLLTDPFTGLPARPEVFWLARSGDATSSATSSAGTIRGPRT